MSDTSEAEPARTGSGPVRRVLFRLVMAVLVLLLAGRTYQETAVALARSDGSLRTAEASVTGLTSHTVSGYSGGGQAGGSGAYFSHTEYTVQLAVGERRKRIDDVTDRVGHDLWEGKRVVVGLWHDRIVEIDGRDVWPGWHFGTLDVTLIVLSPVTTAWLISLAVSAAALLAARTGRVPAGRDDRFGPCALGSAVGAAALLGLLGYAAFGHVLAYWPAVPVCAGTAVALARLGTVVRRLGRIAAEAAPPGAESAPARA
ncbi:hypothetical protein [Streptomyces rishiriensis]|uniref:Integral membrane protein n=1 Tax=Streptomyces rishiriensis TaxID=68264 RepID=A0ABU0P0T4_STRRH|nr:hypothetical protein [Streptomyces rishiriensis]MDQ0585006.1 hypothetical protein [Streptomyces rishiriensis]